jgi:hypothetical protein
MTGFLHFLLSARGFKSLDLILLHFSSQQSQAVHALVQGSKHVKVARASAQFARAIPVSTPLMLGCSVLKARYRKTLTRNLEVSRSCFCRATANRLPNEFDSVSTSCRSFNSPSGAITVDINQPIEMLVFKIESRLKRDQWAITSRFFSVVPKARILL